LRHAPVHFVGRAFATYAAAVLAGRRGEASEAVALVETGDRDLDGFAWYRHLGRRHAAEAAIGDGWGAPEVWLADALAYFDGNGDDRLASACRALLRRAGAPVPRRRGDQAEHEALRALGVTAREAEVLTLLGEGLANRDIGERLFMSPRTVERHVASLVNKAGVARRAELVAFAARLADVPEP
jgi:DNA-binding CsgD family transcriptional regulator